MDIYALMQDSGADIFYDDAFRRSVEDHLPYLKSLKVNQVINVEPMQAYKYAGDFFALLTSLNIPMKYHWIVMRLNDMLSPQDYKDTQLEFIYPPPDELKKISRLFLSQNKLRR